MIMSRNSEGLGILKGYLPFRAGFAKSFLSPVTRESVLLIMAKARTGTSFIGKKS